MDNFSDASMAQSPQEQNRKESTMDTEETYCFITSLNLETTLHILTHLDAKAAVVCSQTCKQLRQAVKFCDPLWKRLCRNEFELKLRFKKPFAVYYDIYRLVAMSRRILRVYLSERFYASGRYGVFPGWLWTWVALCTCTPQLPKWILSHREAFLRLKLSELPLGRISRTWGVSPEQMAGRRALRTERGTAYYTWHDVHQVALQKYGGASGLLEHSLKRCARAAKHIEKNFYELDAGRQIRTNEQRPIVSIATSMLLSGYLQPWQGGRADTG